jgi:hypothetical protein
MPCKGGGPGLVGIARRLGGSGGVLVAFSPRAMVLRGRLSTCGRQPARVPRAAADRAAAWHPSSVANFFIMACGSAGLPVSASNIRTYPTASTACGSGEWNTPQRDQPIASILTITTAAMRMSQHRNRKTIARLGVIPPVSDRRNCRRHRSSLRRVRRRPGGSIGVEAICCRRAFNVALDRRSTNRGSAWRFTTTS